MPPAPPAVPDAPPSSAAPPAPPAPPGPPPAAPAPPAGAAAPPAPPDAAPVEEAAPSSSVGSGRPADPHGLAVHVEGLSSATRKRSAAAVLVASMVIEDGETVEAIVCGEFQAHDAVAVLTDRRLLCVNARDFAPDQASIALTDLDDVKGWIEGNRATLQISGGSLDLVLGDVREVEAAQKFASDLRTNLS
ncbi:MAG: hypothetical protein AAF567_21715 [Actinomycetota bacterium]